MKRPLIDTEYRMLARESKYFRNRYEYTIAKLQLLRAIEEKIIEDFEKVESAFYWIVSLIKK